MDNINNNERSQFIGDLDAEIEKLYDQEPEERAEFEQFVIGLRRRLHRRPELSGQENETAAVIADLLQELGLEVTTGLAGTGIKGVLRGKAPGRTIAFRADMDALQVTEENDLPFASEIPHVMHACGHDGHMAAVTGAAKLITTALKGKKPKQGNIVFLFQPSEELPPGGAKFMIDEGVLDDPQVDRVIGLHNSPNFPSGMIIVPEGSVTAGSDLFELIISGPGGHGARPERSTDTVLVACHFVVLVQSMVSRKFTPGQWPVITVGTLSGGSAHNVIPQEIRMTGTVRSFGRDCQVVKEEMEIILDSLVKLFGGSYSISYRFGYPATINDHAMAEMVRGAAEQNNYFKWVETSLDRAYVSDDFGYFSMHTPACYFVFGVGGEGNQAGGPLHTGKYFMDDAVLPQVSHFLAQIAAAYID